MSDTNNDNKSPAPSDEPPWAAEERQIRAIRDRRIAAQQCVYCGQPLGYWDKAAKRTQHKNCDTYKP